jgi:hypothetical protein
VLGLGSAYRCGVGVSKIQAPEVIQGICVGLVEFKVSSRPLGAFQATYNREGLMFRLAADRCAGAMAISPAREAASRSGLDGSRRSLEE